MKSARPKVLHEIAGRSMLGHVAGRDRRGRGDPRWRWSSVRDATTTSPRRRGASSPSAEIFVQGERLGTAHAVLAARAALERGADDVVVAFADTPLVEPATFERLRAPLADGRDRRGARLRSRGPDRLRPSRHATMAGSPRSASTRTPRAEERRITLCNAGLMALRGERALALLGEVGNRNAKGEYYLTDRRRDRPRRGRDGGRRGRARGRGAGHQRSRPARRGRKRSSRRACGSRR